MATERQNQADRHSEAAEGIQLSIDADPLAPRTTAQDLQDQHESSQQGNQETPQPQETEGADFVNIPMPDPNWPFNSFLTDLADEINSDELDKLKRMFTQIIGKGTLEKIKKPMELFDTLRRRLFMDRNNVLYLQAILLKLNRPELIKKAIQYSQKFGNVIHFQEVAAQQVNGYKNITVHVEGKDFQNCKQSYILDLRSKVSAMLFTPPECVLIAGVEPSSSMLITIMIPDMYADIFEDMLKRGEPLPQLCEMEIDTVKIGDTAYNVRGVGEVVIVETEQQTNLMNVYRQLQESKRQLENVESECMILSADKEDLKEKADDLELVSAALKGMFYKTTDGKDTHPSSLASQAALEDFKTSLSEVKTLGYDKNVIRKLLHVNSTVASIRAKEYSRNQVQQLQLSVKEMQSQLVPLQLEVQFYRTFEAGSLDQLLMNSLQVLLESFRVPAPQVQQVLTDFGNDLLKKISHSLRYKERKKLEKRYTWAPGDKLTIYKDKDPNCFLACLFYKEIEHTNATVDLDSFIEGCLLEVNRPDLQKKYVDKITKARLAQSNRHRSPSGQGQPDEPAAPPPRDEEGTKVANEVHMILEKVTSIDELIKSTQKFGLDSVPSKLFDSGAYTYPFQQYAQKQKQWESSN